MEQFETNHGVGDADKMNRKNNKNPRLITIFHHNFWLNSRTRLDFMPGNMSMKTKKKSACIDFRTNLETSLNGHIQLVDSNERLISFHYQLSHIPVEPLYKKYHGGNQQ
jgi:hypothetical protein